MVGIDGLADLLHRTVRHVEGLGDGFEAAAETLRHLETRLDTESFHLAILGQFKRGKSTFLNALLGQELLPTSVIPLTAIPTFLRWGPVHTVRIVFEDERPDSVLGASGPGEVTELLERFVTEEANPENRLGVLQADVSCPADILARGLVLIDTPGIGSTYQHNTETTLNFLPQCDAALFLVSADPPVTEVEMDFLGEVRGKISRLFFLFNKADYLSSEDREKAVAFFRDILVEKVGLDRELQVFPLSARDGLRSRLDGNEEGLASSGLVQVEEHLVEFLMLEKTAVLKSALAGKAADMVAGVRLQEEIRVRSLQMPLHNLEERMGTLEGKIREAQSQRKVAGDLLGGDRKRAMELLEEQAGQLREKAGEYLGDVVTGAVSGAPGRESMEKRAHGKLAESIPGFFEHELGAFSREFDRHVTEVLLPHQSRADELIEAVRKAAAELFEIPYHAPESSELFEEVSQPYWVTRKWNTSFNSIPVGAVDWLLPGALKRTVTVRRLMKQVEDLAVHNVENLRWATLQNLDRAFRRFTSTLDGRLVETVDATHGAVKAAVERRQEHSDKIDGDLSKLESSLEELAGYHDGFLALAEGQSSDHCA
jgi:GTP-binding protein EngB required for normal cell division